MAEPIAETIAEPTTEIVAELDAINQPTEETETVKDPITETMIEFGTEAVLESRTDGEVQNDSVELTAEIVKKGLKTLGVNPLTLKHALLELNLINEKIRSIEILRDYPNIMYMNLSSNAIDSLQALQHLPTLVQLNISDNNLTECLDFAPPICTSSSSWATGHKAIGSMLTLANLNSNKIESIRVLADHRFLECLLLSSNCIAKIQGLSKLQYLRVLDLSYNKITAIEGLENLPIQELNLSHNSITSLEGLSNLPNLTSLNVSDNNIVSFFPLASCSQLSYLDSSKNRITHIRQVEFLKDIPWLKVLLLTDNPCYRKVFYRLRVIFRLPKLERLDHVNVSNNERVVSRNLHQSPDGDLPLRAENFSRYLPNDEFMDYGPQLAYDDENELTYQQLCAEGLEGFESKKDSNLTEPIAESAEEQKESVIFDDVAQEMQNDLN